VCREVESALMSSQAAFHITVALEIIHLRDAAAGARDILSEATTTSGTPLARRSCGTARSEKDARATEEPAR